MRSKKGDLRRFVTFLVISTLIFPLSAALLPTNLSKASALSSLVERISGSDRYLTAVQASQRGWASSDWVIVANGENFPDALAGAALAGAYDCPLLLTEASNLNDHTKNEIKRLNASNCFILGGTGVVSSGVATEMKSQTSVGNVTRLGGADRYETAALIARQVKSKVGSRQTAIVVTGEDFPDALAASSFSSNMKFPILLVSENLLPAPTADVIHDIGVTSTIVVGGPSAVSDSVLHNLPSPMRIYGSDRYETATKLADIATLNYHVFQRTMITATGTNFPDALAGGSFAAKVDSLMILVHPNSLGSSPVTKTYLAKNQVYIDEVYILGGTGAVSDSVKESIVTVLVPQVFDPYLIGKVQGQLDIDYVTSQPFLITVEIMESKEKVVRTLMKDKLQASGKYPLTWVGVIDFPEMGLEGDKSVMLAPDGEYKIKLTAKNANNTALYGVKEAKVWVKTGW